MNVPDAYRLKQLAGRIRLMAIQRDLPYPEDISELYALADQVYAEALIEEKNK